MHRAPHLLGVFTLPLLLPKRSPQARGQVGRRDQDPPAKSPQNILGWSQHHRCTWTIPASLLEVTASQPTPPCFPGTTVLLRHAVKAQFYKRKSQKPQRRCEGADQASTQPACRALWLCLQATASSVPGPATAVSHRTAHSSSVGPWAPVFLLGCLWGWPPWVSVSSHQLSLF